MRRVLATAGHVDHGKSTLVRALTGRDPDRLAEERARGLTIELGFAWTRLPGGADVAFVDVPGHQRFVGTTLSGLGPSPAVLFVVAADQGWQAQSSEHLAAVRALGIADGLLVLTRADLADDARREAVRAEASRRLAGAGLDVPARVVSARTGEGLEALRSDLDALVARSPAPDPGAPVRLWCDRAFSVSGAGTVLTGTLGAGTLTTGDRLTLLSVAGSREVVVRGLHSGDEPQDAVGPVSRVAVNLRRTGTGEAGRSAVLLTPGAFATAAVVDVALEPVAGDGATDLPELPDLTERLTLHVGTTDRPVRARPLGARHARLTSTSALPWRVGDRAVLRDPGSRRLWAARVVDVDPLPLRRRGAARQRAEALAATAGDVAGLAGVRVASRTADHVDVLARLGLVGADGPAAGGGRETDGGGSAGGGGWLEVGPWLVAAEAVPAWAARLGEAVRAHHAAHPLSPGMPVAEAVHALELPAHLRPVADGGSLPADLPAPGPSLVRLTAAAASPRLTVADGRVADPAAGGLGAAEPAVARLEERLRPSPFAAPERDDLTALGLGAAELAAAARLGRLLRLADDVVLLPDAPARAMRVLAGLEQPFTLSEARQALGTTRRVAVPLLEHLDGRGWTRRLDGQLRSVVR